MKVKQSFGHKSVIFPLFKRIIKPENFFFKSCSVWYAIWEFLIKSKIKQSCDHKAVISSLLKIIIESKNCFLQKLFILVCYLRMSHEKWKLSSHLVNVITKQSFCHFLRYLLNQKTSFTKVVQFCMQFQNVS